MAINLPCSHKTKRLAVKPFDWSLRYRTENREYHLNSENLNPITEEASNYPWGDSGLKEPLRVPP